MHRANAVQISDVGARDISPRSSRARNSQWSRVVCRRPLGELRDRACHFCSPGRYVQPAYTASFRSRNPIPYFLRFFHFPNYFPILLLLSRPPGQECCSERSSERFAGIKTIPFARRRAEGRKDLRRGDRTPFFPLTRRTSKSEISGDGDGHFPIFEAPHTVS